MRRRVLLTTGAALLTAAAAAIAVPAVAGALTATPAPAPTTVTAASFTSATGSRVGAVAGLARTMGSTAAGKAASGSALAATAATACAEPNCNLGYHGGPVQHTPHVYVLFWGPQWNNANNATMKTAKGYVNSFFGGLGKTPTDVWTQTVGQYKDKTGQPTFGAGGVLAGVRTDPSSLPSSITPTALGNEAAKAIGIFKITDVKNAEIVVMPQSGACFHPLATNVGFGGNCGRPQRNLTAGYCAYHSFDVNSSNPSLFLPWINLPFQPDAADLCNPTNIGITNPNVEGGFSVNGGHEVMETITDPEENAWYDGADATSGGEVADKCAWAGNLWGQTPPDPYGNVKLSTGTFLMQSLWTNVINQHCTMTGKLQLTVTQPANQSTKVNVGVRVQIHATINGRTPLRYGESGLPKGIVIDHNTGLITGKPTVKGTFAVKINVTYYAGSALLKFTWTVS